MGTYATASHLDTRPEPVFDTKEEFGRVCVSEKFLLTIKK
jgi:hypothetical protein